MKIIIRRGIGCFMISVSVFLALNCIQSFCDTGTACVFKNAIANLFETMAAALLITFIVVLLYGGIMLGIDNERK